MIERKIEENATIALSEYQDKAQQTFQQAVEQLNSSNDLSIAAQLTDTNLSELHVAADAIHLLLNAEGTISATFKNNNCGAFLTTLRL